MEDLDTLVLRTAVGWQSASLPVELVLELVSGHSRVDELLRACQQRRSTERRLDLRTGQVQLSEGRRDGVPRLDDHHLTTYLGPQARLILIGAGDLSRFMSQMAL